MRNFKLRRLTSGFTLIEVMVALLILALVAGSLSVAVSQSTQHVASAKEHQFAAWVAHNQLSLYLLKPQSLPAGNSHFGGIEFVFNIVKDNTDTGNFNKFTVTVANAKTQTYQLATIVAFKAQL